jgi:5'-nucleotidase
MWGALLLVLLAAGAQAAPVHVTILAINDVHGNLEPPPGGLPVADPAHPGKNITIAAGGLARMATLVKRLKAQNPNTIFVAGGDLIGASPLLSGLFHDEPTVEALSQMGLSLSSVGNHEFDKGIDELLRIQHGGCSPTYGCTGGHVFQGARFQYLAASPVFTSTGRPVLPPYAIRRFGGVPVAFIGLTRIGTLGLISPKAAEGLTFRNDAETVNALVPRLQAQGVKAIVLLIHGGGRTTGGPNDCEGLSDGLAEAVAKFDPAIKLIITADSHFGYVCTINGRLVTQAFKYTMLVTKIDLEIDRKSRRIVAQKAVNLVVDPGLPADPAVEKIIANYRQRAGALVNKVVATIPAPLASDANPDGESPLGDLVADAELAAGGHAQIAVANKGGIRVPLAKAGPVTFGDLYAVLPFGNNIVTEDLTGAQVKTMIEQQWNDPNVKRPLQVSRGLQYEWDGSKPYGSRVVSLTLDGKPVDPAATYRVAAPDFMVYGGDGFTVLKDGRNGADGGSLLGALVAYLPDHVPANGDTAGRIKRIDSP